MNEITENTTVNNEEVRAAHWSRKGIITGMVIAVILLTAILWQVPNFIDLRGLSYLADHRADALAAVSVVLSLLIIPCLGRVPKKSGGKYKFYLALVFFSAPMAAVAAVERLNGNYLSDLQPGGAMWIDNYVVALMFYLLIFALSGSVRIPIFLMQPVTLLFGMANMFVKEFKGSPLVPTDVGSIATASKVAGAYTYNVGCEIIYAVCLTVFFICLASHLSMWKRSVLSRVITRLIPLIIIIAFASTFYFTDTFYKLNYKPDFFNQMRGYEKNGAILEFMLNTKYLKQTKPEGYDEERVPQIVYSDGQEAYIGKGLAQPKSSLPKDPNVIVIMDEAYSDLGVLGEFETSEDYSPFIHSLKKDTIQGDLYVSVIGTGTSNTEYEFLTGNSMAFLPAGSNAFQLYVKDEQPGLVSTLESQGYTSFAYHPYFRSNWNRPEVYGLMGFNHYRSIEDMFDDDIIEKYEENLGNHIRLKNMLKSRYGRSDILLRQYVSDDYDFEEVIGLYEKRDKSKPFFLFNVTMQNHSPYDRTFTDLQQDIKLEGLKGDYPKTEQYLNIIKRTDDAFRELVEYFAKVDEPTVILFFGDHQPSLEAGFYKEVMGAKPSDLSDGDQQKRYISHMVLWANYDIQEGEIDKISANYLSTLLLETAGLEPAPYNEYLARLYNDMPVITAAGCLDKDGGYFNYGDEAEMKDVLDDYACVAYNNATDTKNRHDRLFYIIK